MREKTIQGGATASPKILQCVRSPEGQPQGITIERVPEDYLFDYLITVEENKRVAASIARLTYSVWNIGNHRAVFIVDSEYMNRINYLKHHPYTEKQLKLMWRFKYKLFQQCWDSLDTHNRLWFYQDFY